jgi:hypothetical protein
MSRTIRQEANKKIEDMNNTNQLDTGRTSHIKAAEGIFFQVHIL